MIDLPSEASITHLTKLHKTYLLFKLNFSDFAALRAIFVRSDNALRRFFGVSWIKSHLAFYGCIRYSIERKNPAREDAGMLLRNMTQSEAHTVGVFFSSRTVSSLAVSIRR